MEHLKQIFKQLQQVGLMLHQRKCVFGSHKVLYLGHLISGNGILPNPEKITAVKSFPTPTSVKSLHQFLGLASYYQRFIPVLDGILS